MTKAGISHLTRCLAVEWGKHNITVNAVAPTFIAHAGHRVGSGRSGTMRADLIERIAACTVSASRWTWPAPSSSWPRPRRR